jgi:transcriptional regulator with XRE-family HTH domain
MSDASILVRGARKRAALTQVELATRMGTTQTAIARLERRGSNPRLSTLRRALAATGHDLSFDVVARVSEVDEDQIRAHLRMTPAERLDAFVRAHRNVRTGLLGGTSAR